jgi:hypothetical protein
MALLVLVACQAPSLTVGNKYMDAVVRNDAEAMIATISDDMVMVVDGGPFFSNELTGKEALRQYIQGNAATGFQLELTGDPVVAGNQVTYPDRFAMDVFRQVGVEWVNGVDVVTVENGKVTRDVWTIDEASMQELGAAFAALEALSPQELVGTWRADGGVELGVTDMTYRADGTYQMIRYVAGGEVLWDEGTFMIDGDKVALNTTADHYCKVGDSGVYQLTIGEEGKMENRPIDDICWRRKPPVDVLILERMTP